MSHFKFFYPKYSIGGTKRKKFIRIQKKKHFLQQRSVIIKLDFFFSFISFFIYFFFSVLYIFIRTFFAVMQSRQGNRNEEVEEGMSITEISNIVSEPLSEAECKLCQPTQIAPFWWTKRKNYAYAWHIFSTHWMTVPNTSLNLRE